jgi:hypothetical protein
MEEDDAEVLEALAPVPVSLNMKSEDAEALDLAADSDDEVQDPGMVSRMMGMFTDLFGGALPLHSNGGSSGEAPPDEDLGGIVSPRGGGGAGPLTPDADLPMETPPPVVDSDSGSSDSMV